MSTAIAQKKDRIDLNAIQRKQINLVIFGHGNVGGKLIEQLQGSRRNLSIKRNLSINIFAIANSTKLITSSDGFNADWRWTMTDRGRQYTVEDVVDFAKQQGLDNLIAIDNSASEDLVEAYPQLVAAGFNLISSNKIANTRSLDFYKGLRDSLAINKKEYLYETNVGAGLPLIDTIKLLHLSGENITRIKGVFSGTLSYLFNEFSLGNKAFSEVLHSAIGQGLTEPDPRIDLSGVDVGRKLLILARELELDNELSDVSIQNLIPKEQRNGSVESFLQQTKNLDVPFHIKRKNQKPGHVLRYVADLHGDLSRNDGARLRVQLESVPQQSVLGQLQGSDSLFEIYTENYGDKPIVIQGAGAGAAVTARGVFGDVLRLADKLN
mgnify:CR=1 FL=1